MKQWLIAATLMTAVGTTATAGTATSNMNVTATVTASCSITAGALAFPNYDAVTGAQIDGSATLSVACSRGAITTIMLGQGSNPAPGSSDVIPLRRMKDSGTNMLSYLLFSDPTRLLLWGNTVLTGVQYIPATSSPTNVTVYGRIVALQDVPAGSYSDVVVATISF